MITTAVYSQTRNVLKYTTPSRLVHSLMFSVVLDLLLCFVHFIYFFTQLDCPYLDLCDLSLSLSLSQQAASDIIY